jgi:hypothetical protein
MMNRKYADRIMQKSLICFILIASIATNPGCGSPNSVSPYLYLLIPNLRAGQARPTTPGDLTGSYDMMIPGIRLKWNPSLDPDTNQRVPFYNIYLYPDGPPQKYYENKNLYDITNRNEYIIPSAPPPTNLYFVVTGFDGLAESLPSNIVTIRPL